MKKIAILTLALWSISNVFAFKPLFESQVRAGERSHIEALTQEWLQNNDTDDSKEASGRLRGYIGNDEDPNDNLSVPIGALPLSVIFFLLGSYGVVRSKKFGFNNPVSTP